ncbi:hypothetical protein [Streptomyces sp. NPDC091278]|uniref:hypothetical protein n=1 Tax=Streptomyces sp. NPDC091278 TaxID=3155301 RepID=UPI00344C35C7
MRISIAHPTPTLTGNCPDCSGSFETCRCGTRPQLGAARTLLPVQAGIADDIEREDEAKGLEPYDDLAALHQLVRHLVADGDHRAQQKDVRARRTLGEMAPGHTRQPLLTLHRPQMESVCPLCDKSPCAPLCPFRAALAPDAVAVCAGSAW